MRNKSSAEKLIVTAAAPCQNHPCCIRLFSLLRAATHIFVSLCNLYLVYRLRLLADLLQISSNPRTSIKKLRWRWEQSQSDFFEKQWTDIHMHTNLLIWKHEWSTKFKTLQIPIAVHVCAAPGKRTRSHSWLQRDFGSVARSYLWREADQSTGNETNKTSRLKGISLRRQHCFQSDKHDLSWSVGLYETGQGQQARADCFPQTLPVCTEGSTADQLISLND